MQQVNINSVSYQVPISWSELTYKQGVSVIKNVDDKAKQLYEITGIPLEIIDKLQDSQAHSLFSLISFTENLEVFDSENVLENLKDFDFGSISYGDAERCRAIMSSSDSGYDAVIDIIKILKQIDISEMSFLEAIGSANFFLSKSIISMIVSPNSMKLKEAMNKSKQVLSDFKILEALERTLKLQEVEH